MHFSEIKQSRSICINGEWDNVEYKIHLEQGDSLLDAENDILKKVDEWELSMRTKRATTSIEATILQQGKEIKVDEEYLASEIMKARGLIELKSFELIATPLPIARKAYMERYAQLTTNNSKQ